ncbi:hypothetical protein KVP10_08310 [Candidimonas humi]|uniref:Uncharacterized protein n=1 Tax=Candidimonas humi TaxID=683355 RepID=A0ABV8NUP4_9BURK|nr:hypothetical protein [Candidimonas humi]MBV6304888.1 hypothetical protein [Candidimonas humi]
MKLSKYAEFDDLLIHIIKSGRNTFTTMQTQQMTERASSLATADRFGRKLEFRVFDRRLQALSKAGKIRFKGGVWSVVEEAKE